jgi:carbamoyltransferase
MYILGISCFYHDAAAALLKDGELIVAAEEERFTRKKHDFSFPQNAISFCLEYANISSKSLDWVVFYEKPFVKFERILLSTLSTFPKSWKLFMESMITWLQDKLWIKKRIKDRVGVKEERILFLDHHLSHAASAFLCSPFEKSAILTCDGVGEWATTCFGVGEKNSLKLEREIRFPHSLGLLYSAFTAFLGFEVNEGEYKVMGMAPYGEPRYVDEVYKLIEISPDGSFSLNMDYFSYHYSVDRTFNKKFIELFGEPRDPKMHFFTKDTEYPSYFGERPEDFSELAEKNQHYADIAASIQYVTEEILVKIANSLYDRYRVSNLCIAGGVGLNSCVNRRILKESPFERLFVQPQAGDGGGALGAALYTWCSILGNPRRFVLEDAYWGKDYTEDEIKGFLEKNNIRYEYLDEDQIIERTVDALCGGKVVGWFSGRFEWGPRALGNRSILADPQNHAMKDVVNTKIKFREPYRPFAPSILVEDAEEYFDLPGAREHYPARFMLYVADVIKDKQDTIPAVTHVDGTGRLQTVFSETNPRYYKLIRAFKDQTGVPVLLNTSFNLKGEPIVASPADAYNTFKKSGMDLLVLENFLIKG